MKELIRTVSLTILYFLTVNAKAGKAEFYEPGIIISMSTSFFKEHQNFIYEQFIDYVNDQFDPKHPSWTSVSFEFADVSFSNFKFTESKDLINAPKVTKLKGSCGAVRPAKKG